MTALRKVFISAAGRNGILLLFVMCVTVARLHAQVPVVIGSGTDNNGLYGYPCPLQDGYAGSRSQFLYLSSELKAAGMSAGMVKAISYNVLYAPTGKNTAIEQLAIKIGILKDDFLDPNAWVNGMVQVYGPVDYTVTDGINQFVFNTPFLWNGTDNIVIEICNGDPASDSKTSLNAVVPWTTNLSFQASHTHLSSNTGSLCNAPEVDGWADGSVRPNITFDWTPATACTGTPVAGTTVASIGSACTAENVRLSLQGTASASGLSYQWQFSSDQNNWTPVSGATFYNYNTTQSATTWYRAAVTCAGGGTAYSVPVVVYAPSLASGTYTINKDEAAGGGNFQSFNEAYNFIKCGISGSVTFNVTSATGTYNEQLLIKKIPGASAVNTVTFNGNGQSISFTSTESYNREVIRLDGASHVRFSNLVVNANGTGYTEYGYGIHLLNNADSNTISDCVITVDTLSDGDSFAGIVLNSSNYDLLVTDVSSCDSNTIRNNTITGGWGGVVVQGNSNVANLRNIISGNTIREFYRQGIYLSYTSLTNVNGNHISRPLRTASGWDGNTGIYVKDLNSRMKINANTITQLNSSTGGGANNVYGIYFDYVAASATGGNLVSNNRVYAPGSASNIYGFYIVGSGNVSYYHNTISIDGDNMYGSSFSAIKGVYMAGEIAGSVFNNNIVTIHVTGEGVKNCIHIQDPTDEITATGNDYYVAPGIGGTAYLGYYNFANRSALMDWKTSSGLDAGSFAIDPVYRDLAAGDLHPLNASIDNKGIYTSLVPADIAGTARSVTAPDLGVYEGTPPPCTTPPVPGSAKLSKDTVCANTPVLLNISGYSLGAGQTYQWQSSASAAGPFVNIGSELTAPDTIVRSATNMYYRAQVTCSGMSDYTTPVLLVARTVMAGGTYTLDRTAALGTVDFNSFNQVRDALSCGILDDVVITVIAGSGTYNEQLILNTIPGASANATVTFNGNGNTLLYGPRNPEERAVLKLDGADYVTFDSLKIQVSSSSNFGYGIQLTNNADSNTFRKCTVYVPVDKSSEGYNGIVISAWRNSPSNPGEALCDGNVFDSNTITGGYYGIVASGNEDKPLLNNQFTNNLIQEFYNAGFYCKYSTGTVFNYNRITRPTREEIEGFYGIWLEGSTNRLVVNGNRIYNPNGGNVGYGELIGIYLAGASAEEGQENMITNNLMYNLNGGGFWYAVDNFNSGNTRFYHNTIVLDNPGNFIPTSCAAFRLSGNLDGMEIQNNIIAITRGGTANKVAIFTNADLPNSILDYNDYYVNGAGGNNYIAYHNGKYYAKLDDWRSHTLTDAHSVDIEPVFSAPALGDYKPAVSPMDNTGKGVGITVDIDQKARNSSTPDIGAYEIDLPVCKTPVAGAAVAIPASGICMGTEVDLNLSGNSTGGTQTYQWQDSIAGVAGWKNVGDRQFVSNARVRPLRSSFYRCIVVCGTDTAYSAVQPVALNVPLPGGVYTIDKEGSGNFASFNEAVAAMECGIGGAVTFNVKPGIYNERVRMHYVYGSSDTSRITFRAENGVTASVKLTADATENVDNYVLRLDSASFITYKNLTLESTGSDYGRVVEIRNTAYSDSVLNCRLVAVAAASEDNSMAIVYFDNMKGTSHVIKGNEIENGAIGVYVGGNYAVHPSGITITNNTIRNTASAAVHANYTAHIVIDSNAITPGNAPGLTAYGVRMENCDSTYSVSANNIKIADATDTRYGIYVNFCHPIEKSGKIESNKIIALQNNSGDLYGCYAAYSSNGYVRNNIISIHTFGQLSYAIYGSGSGSTYLNNSVQNSSESALDNYVAYFSGDDVYYGTPVLFNNVLSHTGGGSVLYVEGDDILNSDYNMLYTTGTVLVNKNGDLYTELDAWRKRYFQDNYSVVYKPAFTDAETLQPDIADATAWGMHGRGLQFTGNAGDINGNKRAVTLQEGVPDLGAYEFLPTVKPPVAVAIPALPAPNIRQVFMMGTDTVYAVKWGATAPQDIQVRRYSGIAPPAVPATAKYMYFYVDAEVSGAGAAAFDLKQFYFDSWTGFINPENRIRLGKTNEAGTWAVGAESSVGTGVNVITENNLAYLGKFTGLTDSTVKNADDRPVVDSSSMGTHFWVGYGHHYFFTVDNAQDMVLYFSSHDSANVTVHINGTTWTREYHIPANTAITSDIIPKFGVADARLLGEGKFEHGISIQSDIPIVAYAHIYGEDASGATMLLPTGTYGYEYYALTAPQKYSNNCFSWFYVVADHDSTQVEITPSCVTVAGRPAKVPFVVTLNKGEVYQVLGAMKGGAFSDEGFEVTGSKIRSVANSSGKCYPVAVFSGSGRTLLHCANTNAGGGGDNMIQQNYPYQAWGKRYLTASVPTPYNASATTTNMYRVAVKDPATVVKRNGEVMHDLVNNYYYEFFTDGADYIEADQPVMVAQYLPSDGGCGPPLGAGDPEMVYLSPIEQGIDKVSFYRNSDFDIYMNYLILIIPDEGVKSLVIDGSSTFDYQYAHPALPGYTVVIRRWTAKKESVTATSDVPFTAVTYGLGDVESYGYNAGTLVRNLNSLPGIINTNDNSGVNSSYTCVGTPFRFNLLLPMRPTEIKWSFSGVTGLSQQTDSVQTNPLPIDTVVVNNKNYYRYSLSKDFSFAQAGTYTIPVAYKHPDIESCDNTMNVVLSVQVMPKPRIDFTAGYSGCINDEAQFAGIPVSSNNNAAFVKWNWNFGDNTGSGAQDTVKRFTEPGTYQVVLKAVEAGGCLADTMKEVEALPFAALDFVNDTVKVCKESAAVLAVKNPESGVVYEWYTAAMGGAAVASGNSYTIASVTATTNMYVAAVRNGCASPRKAITAMLLLPLQAPVAVADSIGVNVIRFSWNEVPGARAYEVSIDGGASWQTPSSGAAGNTHLVTGLKPAQEIVFMVKAKGEGDCQDVQSAKLSTYALPDQIFIPNAFSPNGDGLNDEIKVYSRVVKEMTFVVFNQWGEKVFETKALTAGWNGSWQGKPQPSGVYMYVCQALLIDGSSQTKKGAINLVR